MLTFLPGRDVTGESWVTQTFAAVSRMPVGDREPIVWPFTPYYSGNPFQAVLYSGFADRSMVAAPTFAAEHLRQAVRDWPADLPLVVHLHWLNQVLAGVTGPVAAQAALDRHRGLLDELQSHGARLVWTVHNVLPHDSALEEFDVRLRQDVLDRAALVHVMSPRTAELAAPWFTLPADRIYRCDHPGYQGVYPDWISRTDARQRLRIPDGAVAVLMTGGLKPYKGLTEMLDAVRVVTGDPSSRPVVLVVAGNPDDSAEMAGFLARAYLEPHVRVLPGKVADADLQILFRAADLVALPYRRSLNSGVLALALTFGRPALLPSNSGSLPVVSDFPGAALTYDAEGGEEALVGALRRACALDPAEYESACRAAAAAGERIDRSVLAARYADDLRGWADTGVVPGVVSGADPGAEPVADPGAAPGGPA